MSVLYFIANLMKTVNVVHASSLKKGNYNKSDKRASPLTRIY